MMAKSNKICASCEKEHRRLLSKATREAEAADWANFYAQLESRTKQARESLLTEMTTAMYAICDSDTEPIHNGRNYSWAEASDDWKARGSEGATEGNTSNVAAPAPGTKEFADRIRRTRLSSSSLSTERLVDASRRLAVVKLACIVSDLPGSRFYPEFFSFYHGRLIEEVTIALAVINETIALREMEMGGA
jgi:cell pole-organizing protein PopZ